MTDTPSGRWDRGCHGALGLARPPALSKAGEPKSWVKKGQVQQGQRGVCQVSGVLGGAAGTLRSSGQDSSTPPRHRASKTSILCSSDMARPLLHPRAQMRIVTSTHLPVPPFRCGTRVYKRTSPRLAAASHPAAGSPSQHPRRTEFEDSRVSPLPLL